MAWLLLGIIIWASLMFLVTPLLRKNVKSENFTYEIKDYKDEFERLAAEIAAGGDAELEDRKIDLQRQLLAQTQKKSGDASGPSMLVINSLFAFFVFGGIGLYSLLGSPELTKAGALQAAVLTPQQAMTQTADPEHENQASLEGLVAQLKTKLEGERKDDPNGWMLYARTLMNLGRFDDAFSAYEQALILTDDNPEIAEELTRARAFAAQRPQTSPAPLAPAAPRGPSAEDIDAAASMSEADRNAMVQNMVASLAARLKDDPKNPMGWAQLLRARQVLGQTKEAKADIALIKKTYAETPEVAAQILTMAGVEE